MTISPFINDRLWSQQMQSDYMTVLYRHLAGSAGSYVLIGGSNASTVLQKQSVDAVISRNGKTTCIEEKLARWPKKNQPHKNFTLETIANSNADTFAFGWMITAKCDYLLYAFEIQERGITTHFDAYLIHFAQLQRWFWQRIRNFGISTTEYNNHTQTSLVPIAAMTASKSVAFRRYTVTRDRAEDVSSPTSSTRIRPLRKTEGAA